MTYRCSRLHIEDSVQSPPFACIDDLVVVVRTPRSSDFVTVEVGRMCDCSFWSPAPRSGVRRASRPGPWFERSWCGEVRVGEGVSFDLAGRFCRLVLEGGGGPGFHPPWASYDFLFERAAEATASHGEAG